MAFQISHSVMPACETANCTCTCDLKFCVLGFFYPSLNRHY